MRKIKARRKSYFGEEKKNVWFERKPQLQALARGALKTILRFTAKMLIDVQFNNMFWLRGLDMGNVK